MTEGVLSQLATPGGRCPPTLAASPPTLAASTPPASIETAAKRVVPPSTKRAVGQGVVDVVGAGIDVTFGTHWALLEYWEGNKNLRRLRQDAKDVRTWAQALPNSQELSRATRSEIAKNARAQLLFNKYDRYAQHIKRDLQGVGIGTGGLVFGTGMALNSTVFGSFSTALAAVSTPIALFAGTPILSGAAVMLGGYEGLRAWRMHHLRPHLAKLLHKPVVGNEARVHALVKKRLDQTSGHAKARACALLTLAAAPPLLVVGIGPGLAVGIPGVIAGLSTSYYKHTRLLYEAPLAAMACLALGGRRDIGNRIDLADREYQTLKALKREKRAYYPHGSSGVPVLRDVFAGLGAVRRWWTPPRHVAPAHHTIMRFLRAQASHEITYLRQQHTVLAYESKKARAEIDPVERDRRLAELNPQHLYLALRKSLTNKHAVGQDYDAVPSNSEVCTQFMRFVSTHGLDEVLLRALQHDRMYKVFQQRNLLLRQNKQISLKTVELQAVVDTPTENDLTFLQELSAFYERFLLVHEKRVATAMRHQLTEFLALRTYADAIS